jgi:hypothetical protein
MLLPHVQRARELGRAGLLRSRLRFAESATDAAVADAVAVTKMARDCGSDSLLVSLLVGISIEKIATDVLAANLAKLSPPQLDALAAAFKTLPKPAPLADCIRTESRTFGDWIERQIADAAKGDVSSADGKVPELVKRMCDDTTGNGNDAEAARLRTLLESMTMAEVRESVGLLRADQAELASIAALAPAERRARGIAFEARLKEMLKSTKREDTLHFLSQLFLPAVAKAADREDRYNVRRQLFDLAIDVQRRGPDAVRAATVAGHGPVEYRKTGGGFELRCLPVGEEAPEVLRVGAGEPGRP